MDQSILIEVLNTILRLCIFERHCHLACHFGRTQPDFGIAKLETATRARQRNMERLAIECVDYRFTAALHDARYVDLRGSLLEVRVEFDRQKQRLAKFRSGRREDGEHIAQRGACLA